MPRFRIFLPLLAVGLISAVQAQTPAPKPGPELEKLHVFVGHWTGEGQYTNESGKHTVEETDEMILGGFFLQITVTAKETGRQDLWIVGYDPVNKNYVYSLFRGDGTITSGTLTCEGNTWSYARKSSVDGKQRLVRLTGTIAADGMSATWKLEFSSDDRKTWTYRGEDRVTKIEPAAKK